jgi:hypothetical protein
MLSEELNAANAQKGAAEVTNVPLNTLQFFACGAALVRLFVWYRGGRGEERGGERETVVVLLGPNL